MWPSRNWAALDRFGEIDCLDPVPPNRQPNILKGRLPQRYMRNLLLSNTRQSPMKSQSTSPACHDTDANTLCVLLSQRKISVQSVESSRPRRERGIARSKARGVEAAHLNGRVGLGRCGRRLERVDIIIIFVCHVVRLIRPHSPRRETQSEEIDNTAGRVCCQPQFQSACPHEAILADLQKIQCDYQGPLGDSARLKLAIRLGQITTLAEVPSRWSWIAIIQIIRSDLTVCADGVERNQGHLDE